MVAKLPMITFNVLHSPTKLHLFAHLNHDMQPKYPLGRGDHIKNRMKENKQTKNENGYTLKEIVSKPQLIVGLSSNIFLKL